MGQVKKFKQGAGRNKKTGRRINNKGKEPTYVVYVVSVCSIHVWEETDPEKAVGQAVNQVRRIFKDVDENLFIQKAAVQPYGLSEEEIQNLIDQETEGRKKLEESKAELEGREPVAGKPVVDGPDYPNFSYVGKRLEGGIDERLRSFGEGSSGVQHGDSDSDHADSDGAGTAELVQSDQGHVQSEMEHGEQAGNDNEDGQQGNGRGEN